MSFSYCLDPFLQALEASMVLNIFNLLLSHGFLICLGFKILRLLCSSRIRCPFSNHLTRVKPAKTYFQTTSRQAVKPSLARTWLLTSQVDVCCEDPYSNPMKPKFPPSNTPMPTYLNHIILFNPLGPTTFNSHTFLFFF